MSLEAVLLEVVLDTLGCAAIFTIARATVRRVM